jgi:hypothetical protein
MAEEIRDRLLELDRRLRVGDFESLRSSLAPDFYSYEPGPAEPTAADRIADLAAGFKAALPDLTATLSNISIDDADITATLGLRGTHERDLWGAPGSGAVVEWTTPISIRAVGRQFAVRFNDTSTRERVGLIRQLRLVNPADEMDQPHHYSVAPPDFLLKLVMTGEAGDKPCAHLDDIQVTEPTTWVCQGCVDLDDIWPALRMCLICGFVGCCDTSKNRHMADHHKETGHPIFRSINREEGWIWCYEDDAFFEKTMLDRFR